MKNDDLRGFLHKTTENFINLSTLDNKSKLFYPFLDNSINLFKGVVSLKDRRLNKKKFASVLCNLNKEVYSKKLNVRNIKKISIKLKDYNLWHREFGSDSKDRIVIERIKIYFEKYLRKFGKLILHGSFATLDYINGWSDLDFIVILNNGVIQDKNKLIYVRKRLNKIRNLFYLIDPLQHHGFFILSEEILERYSENVFPIGIFKNSVMISGENKIELRIIEKSKKKARNIFLKFCKDLQKNPRNLFEWKLNISKCLLLPSLFLESKGKFVYKKESFRKINSFLNKKERKLLFYLETIRKKWKVNVFTSNVIVLLARISPNPFIPLIPSLLINWKGNKNKTLKIIRKFSEGLIKKC